MRRLPIASLLVLATSACGDPSVDRPDTGPLFVIDGSVAPPDAPMVETLPERIPYPVATLRGTARGRRVIVSAGATNPLAKAIGPGGEFCVDVPLPGPGTYELTVRVQAQDGQLSDPSGPFVVTRDSGAPPVAGARTCGGADPAGCANAVEICGNGRDDDCNNLVDADDPTCRTCSDDALETNDDVGAPRIDPGRYENLMMCPLDPDYYGVYAERGEIMVARVFFMQAEGNLDLTLLGLDRATPVATSHSITDDEMLTHTATATGEYKLLVFSPEGAANDYVLDLAVNPGS